MLFYDKTKSRPIVRTGGPAFSIALAFPYAIFSLDLRHSSGQMHKAYAPLAFRTRSEKLGFRYPL
jgi:hypothetical protein